MGDKLAKIYHDPEHPKLSDVNGKDYVHVPDLEKWGNVAIRSIKVDDWTPYFIRLIGRNLLAWADRKMTAEIIIVKEYREPGSKSSN
jgi:hypothetical protein